MIVGTTDTGITLEEFTCPEVYPSDADVARVAQAIGIAQPISWVCPDWSPKPGSAPLSRLTAWSYSPKNGKY